MDNDAKPDFRPDLIENGHNFFIFIIMASVLVCGALFFYYRFYYQTNKDDMLNLQTSATPQSQVISSNGVTEQERQAQLARIRSITSTSAPANRRDVNNTNSRSSSASGLYRCTDSAGRVTYQSQCPANTNAQRIESGSSNNGIRPNYQRRAENSSRNTAPRIISIRNTDAEINECRNTYNPRIQDLESKRSRLGNAYVDREIEQLRRLRQACIIGTRRTR